MMTINQLTDAYQKEYPDRKVYCLYNLGECYFVGAVAVSKDNAGSQVYESLDDSGQVIYPDGRIDGFMDHIQLAGKLADAVDNGEQIVTDAQVNDWVQQNLQ